MMLNSEGLFRSGQLQAGMHQDKRDYGTRSGAFFINNEGS